MKICSMCKTSKSLEEFVKNRHNEDGCKAHCKVCDRARQKKLYHESPDLRKKQVAKNVRARVRRIFAAIGVLKSKTPCKDCGCLYPPYVMDFDHLFAETKLFSVSQMANRGFSYEKIFEEIAKCELVCSNCHRERTHQRKTTQTKPKN
jgi:hypothetical protein